MTNNSDCPHGIPENECCGNPTCNSATYRNSQNKNKLPQF